MGDVRFGDVGATDVSVRLFEAILDDAEDDDDRCLNGLYADAGESNDKRSK